MKQINQLTFTRFIAAMTIVIYHFGIERDIPAFPFDKVEILHKIFKGGNLGVSYFYVLSGFIMCYNYYQDSGSLDKKKFWIARFSRIYPMHIVALLLMFLVYSFIEQKVTLKSSILQLTLLQSWSFDYRHSFNWPAWSLSVEGFFYAVCPLLLVFFQRNSKKVILLVVFLFWAVSMIQQWFFFIEKMPLPLIHVNGFLVGMLAGYYFRKNQFVGLFNNTTNTIFFLISFAIVIYMATIPEFFISTSGFLAPVFAVLILSIASNTSSISTFFSKKFFILLGEISYCIYILHWPVWLILDKYKMIEMNKDVQFYLYLLLVNIVSYICYKYIEVPSRIYLRNTLSKR